MSRVKDENTNHNHVLEGLTPEMQAFNAELSQKFPSIRYTSGKRNASDKVGKNSNVSRHNVGEAFDFGAEHKDVYDWLTGTQEGLTLLNKHGLGILDETDPETMKKTGATGAHYHIGKDTNLVREAQTKLANFKPTPQQGISQNIGYATPFELITDVDGVPTSTTITPDMFQQEVKKAMEREKETEKKIEESPARQEIEKKKKEKEDMMAILGNKQTPVSQYDGEQPDKTGYPVSQIEMQPIQNSLPDLPNIFQFPEQQFADGGTKGDPPPIKYQITKATSYYDPLTGEIYLNESDLGNAQVIAHELAHAWQRDQGLLRSDPFTPKQTPTIPNSDEVVTDFYNRRVNEKKDFTDNIGDFFTDLTGDIWTPDMNLIARPIKEGMANDFMYSYLNTAEGQAEYLSQNYGNPPGYDLEKKTKDGRRIVIKR